MGELKAISGEWENKHPLLNAGRHWVHTKTFLDSPNGRWKSWGEYKRNAVACHENSEASEVVVYDEDTQLPVAYIAVAPTISIHYGLVLDVLALTIREGYTSNRQLLRFIKTFIVAGAKSADIKYYSRTYHLSDDVEKVITKRI